MKILVQIKKYRSYYKKIDKSISKISKASRALSGQAKGEPDADELRAAILGSPLKKEIAKMKTISTNVAQFASATRNGSLIVDLPGFSWNDLKNLIRTQPTLEDLERLRGNMVGARDILLQRHAKMMETWYRVIPQMAAAKKMNAQLVTLDKGLNALMRLPLIKTKVEPVWLDLKLSVMPLGRQIQTSLESTLKGFEKLNKPAIKRLELYNKMIKTLDGMIKDAQRQSTG
ncbi:hypothetical protein [Actibacterium ureilyticum]|uniref:hypothetical protein n=1 Tax=Actibacterium ureilyticum TaxID=1590614 RepID=UPI0015958B20|nr:hypothetical protein [Actibacterium ureilyticum]